MQQMKADVSAGPTVYLHIGTMKTATSAIQRFLRLNREQLNACGAAYPWLSSFHWYPELEADRNAIFMTKAYGTPAFDACVEEVIQCTRQYPTVILSDEKIYQAWINKWDDLILRLLKPLQQAGITLKIIIYLRRQDEYIYSQWQQEVKQRRDVTFRTYMREPGKQAQLDYAGALERLAQIVGEEHLIVRLFEQEQLLGGSVFTDFLTQVGLSTDRAYIDPGHVNERLRDVCLEAKRRLNRYPDFKLKALDDSPSQEQISIAAHFESLLFSIQEELDTQGIGRDRPAFTRRERLRYLARFRKGNAEVARRYLHRADGILFRAPVPDSTRDNEQPIADDEVLYVLSRMLMKQAQQLQKHGLI